MTLGQTFARLMLSAAVLISVGCVSRKGPSPMVNSRPPVLPSHSKVQLLAAARQYEKEGKTALATRYYRQVLALDSQNVEARQGLQLVQSGRRRSEASYDQIVATGQANKEPLLRTQKNLVKRRAELDALTARLIADAARSAKHVKPARNWQPTQIASKMRAADRIDAPATAVSQAAHATEANTLIAESESTLLDEYEATLLEEDVAMLLEEDDAMLPDEDKAMFLDLVENEQHEPHGASSPDTASEIEIVSADIPDDVEAFDWANGTWAHGQEGDPQSLRGLCEDANAAVLREVAKLESDDPAVRKDGLHDLAQMGPDAASAAECVTYLLDDVVEMVRAYAAWSLWEISGDATTAVPALADLLNSTDPEVVQFSAYTLSWIGEHAQAAAPALRQLLTGRDQLVRVHAAEALTQVEPPAERADAIDALILLTAEASTQVRTLAVVALGNIPEQPTPEITAALASALHDRDAEVRAAAALTLGAFGEAPESAIAQLEFVAVSDQEDVRQAAATALDCILR